MSSINPAEAGFLDSGMEERFPLPGEVVVDGDQLGKELSGR